MKQTELGDGVEKMETGLEKLAEASASVEILKQDLAVMEKDLAEASQKVRFHRVFFFYLPSTATARTAPAQITDLILFV